MRVVGRHTGYFSNEREKDVIEVIRKTSPRILFIGMDYPKDLVWIDKNRKHFTNTVIIAIDYNFDIISGKIKKAPDYFQNRGFTWFYQILSRPYRIISWWLLFKFVLLTYFYHFFGKKKSKK
jgi:N-acetylglucosaminyldiphosphoundecaprenol N-acetyl-beta-D-mannosaminyltransferase